ncbi:hypothetical protein ERC79_10505 [Rhodococcus sp. ABRD24]|uniref:hypothetical protein n=1 Tax=Rhodococcus sp. ABRD24 TaxID=2507582 RepID=UPI00103A167D|nr:hypothetical protein [Rhodococcus sp. ABRD24]QBJ96348.1 hypothetical protein ERC79_10505 [Rhodococcus sp. ABRD24]
MAVLSAVSAELLSAYADSTGRVGPILFEVVFFAALYGAPALLAREAVRRAGWGWDSLLMIMLALAIAQACLIDQSLFSENYHGYDGWAVTYQATLIPVFGISASSAYNFILGHVIFSFGAPVALAEAWQPERAREGWLGRTGLIIATAAYVGAAMMIMSDPESRNASAHQLFASGALVIVCLVLTYLLGRRYRRKAKREVAESDPAPVVGAVFAVMLTLACLRNFAGENWSGFLLGVGVTVGAGALILIGARRPGWGIRCISAVALAFLISRGVFAFTYDPLIGTVAPIPKYVHNVIMLVIVLVAGWFALKRSKSVPPSGLTG